MLGLLVAATMLAPSCEIQARYAQAVMTEIIGDIDNMFDNVEQKYALISTSGPTWQHSIWLRASEKFAAAPPNFNPWDPADAQQLINNFRTTTFLACKAGV
jgi:hypothetical protein